MAYKLTKDRAKFILEDLIDKGGYPSLDHDIRPSDWFEVMTFPWEVHYYASRFNWEGDLSALNWIIDTQLCDKATVLMTFWRAGPKYYTQYATQEEADAAYGGGVYALIRKIILNWESDYYVNQRIAYDPFAEFPDHVQFHDPEAKWLIPDSLRVVLAGEEIIVE